jgi:hypothetical protein
MFNSDDFLRFQSFDYLDLAVMCGPDANRARIEQIVSDFDENERFSVDSLNSGGGDQNSACGRAGKNAGLGEHFRLEHAVGIGDFRASACHAVAVVHFGANPGELAGENPVGQRFDSQFDGLSHFDPGEGRFGNVEHGPHCRAIGQSEERFAGLHQCAAHGCALDDFAGKRCAHGHQHFLIRLFFQSIDFLFGETQGAQLLAGGAMLGFGLLHIFFRCGIAIAQEFLAVEGLVAENGLGDGFGNIGGPEFSYGLFFFDLGPEIGGHFLDNSANGRGDVGQFVLVEGQFGVALHRIGNLAHLWQSSAYPGELGRIFIGETDFSGFARF